MLPQTQPRKRRNSSKVNLLISLIFHAVLIGAMFYFAARQGLLGKRLKKIAVQMVKEKPRPKPKATHKPKVKLPPKPSPPQVAQRPKPVASAKPAAPRPAVPPPASEPAVAPPPAELPSFVFAGGKTVESTSDPVQLYKGALEYAFRSKWERPPHIHDDRYVVEVRVKVGRDGSISDPQWVKGSGNAVWDESVRRAIAAVTNMDRPPPTNFPPRILVRFDVRQITEPLLE